MLTVNATKFDIQVYKIDYDGISETERGDLTPSHTGQHGKGATEAEINTMSYQLLGIILQDICIKVTKFERYFTLDRVLEKTVQPTNRKTD